jgi:putative iron-dependent peroxidase
LARVHTFALLRPDVDAGELRKLLATVAASLYPQHAVLGVGAPLVQRLEASIPGLIAFPALSGSGVSVPSTQAALFCLLAGGDRGEIFHQSRRLCAQVAAAFSPVEIIDTFIHRDSRDLTGYEDGTENPKGEAAIAAAVVAGKGPGLDGGSFVAMQRWTHAFERFEQLSMAERDALFGRSFETNEELPDAPESAHVKRTAQETFDPPAFMVRRSMPYVGHASDGGSQEAGLCFLAFIAEIERYEQVLRRMLGMEDGIVDALFSLSQPKSGGYYFCAPVRGSKLDLSVLGV